MREGVIDSMSAVMDRGVDGDLQSIRDGQGSQLNRGELDGDRSASVDTQLGSSSIFDAQIWLGRSPWQPAAGWSVIAALLTWVPLTQWFGSGSVMDWRLVALILLLVDPLWGSIWRFSAGRSTILPLRADVLRRRFWLPYLSADSPAARLMGIEENSAYLGALDPTSPQTGMDMRNDKAEGEKAGGVYPVLLRVTLPSMLLAMAVAAVLGVDAVWMTCLVILLSVLAWVRYSNLRESQQGVDRLSHYRQHSHLLRALITVALPWGLTLLQMQSAQLSDSAMLDSTRLGSSTIGVSWILLLLWVVHSWGEGRCLQLTVDRLGIGLLAASNLGMALLMIMIGVPMGLGILSVIWFATWLSIYNGSSLRRLQGWWLLAMLVSGASVGFSGLF